VPPDLACPEELEHKCSDDPGSSTIYRNQLIMKMGLVFHVSDINFKLHDVSHAMHVDKFSDYGIVENGTRFLYIYYLHKIRCPHVPNPSEPYTYVRFMVTHLVEQLREIHGRNLPFTLHHATANLNRSKNYTTLNSATKESNQSPQ
jgi:hypothetical protein